MAMVTDAVIAIVILLHVYFLVLEMFLWDKPLGLKTFCQTAEVAAVTKTLAANQGLYNGFLAAGLIWGFILGESGVNVIIFFLCCVVIAGIFGALTASRKILYIQAMPALLGLGLVLLT